MSSSPAANASQPPRRFVLVTGTSTGIGYACAIQLARDGFGVIAGVRNEQDAAAVERAGANTPLGIRALQMDVTDAAAIEAAAAITRDHVGQDGLCGLVNNAGICVVGPTECISMAHWRHQFEVNFFGAIAVTKAMLPLLRVHNSARGKWAARIVNISSVTGEVSTPLFGAYSTSKSALAALGDCLRLELAAHGIHVCTIVPGTIQSEIWRKEKEGVNSVLADSTARTLYGKLIANVSDYVFKCADKAMPAQSVAKAVRDCLTSRSPRPRTFVGWEAVMGSKARRFMPDRLLSYLLGRTLGVPSGKARQ